MQKNRTDKKCAKIQRFRLYTPDSLNDICDTVMVIMSLSVVFYFG